MSYILGVNNEKMLQTMYWGPLLAAGATLPQPTAHPERASFDAPITTTPLEYPAWGGGLYTEPALKLDESDGDRTLVLKFSEAHVAADQLEILLHDQKGAIAVHLFYKPYPQGVLARWSRIENQSKEPVRIEQAASATWNLPEDADYKVSWLTGQWGAEFQLHTAPLQTGSMVLESHRGSTSHQASPWFSLGRAAETTETNGPVWFGELGWSGSWRMTIEATAMQQTRVTAGFNPFDFAYVLSGGQSLETPLFYGGYSGQGDGGASRILHRFEREEILPSRPDPRPRPIIYNSWEATRFDLTEAGQLQLASKAAQLGVERFIMDDGWFGERSNDHVGLGDWTVNKTKFPHGLKSLIDGVHALGMDFGIWVEPEMVNPDSELYRSHPDWVMSFPNRQRTESRNQLVLNLARPDVQKFVFDTIDKLVSENDIAFLKWDYNRNWSEPGWDSAHVPIGVDKIAVQKEIYVVYVRSLYEILDRLRKKHPRLEIESCSGGGGRVDLGILRYTDEVWPSDNTDALDRLSIQDGFTHAYAPEIMAAWVTDSPNKMNLRAIPLEFRFLTAMQGALGLGGNLAKWSADDLASAERYVHFDKSIRSTVQQGLLYRLMPPQTGNATQVEYVSQDGSQAVLFAYLQSQRYQLGYPVILPQGLDPAAFYRVQPLDMGKYHGERTIQGSVLMNLGLHVTLQGDYDSTAIVLQKVS